MDKKAITCFSRDWFKDPDFEDWIASASSNTEARCWICCKNFELSNMGRQAPVSHANGKKHKLHVDWKQMFFKPKKVIVLDEETVQTSVFSSQDTELAIDIAVKDFLHKQVVLLIKMQSRPLILCWMILKDGSLK